jgi:BirA family biotin operon repressor/biotin-[acetyl-CoA-carboxylase] ligase
MTAVVDLRDISRDEGAARIGAGSVSLIGPVAGLAMRQALRSIGAIVDLKWPNDLVVGPAHPRRDAKLGGILAEAIWPTGAAASVASAASTASTASTASKGPESLPTVLVGIGINLDPRSIPPELGDTAISLDELVEPVGSGVVRSAPAEPGPSAAVMSLIGEFADGLDARVGELVRSGPAALRAEWIAACCTLGRQVRAIMTGSTTDGEPEAPAPEITGRAETIFEDGALGIRTADGSMHRVLVGDLFHLR